MTTEQKDNYAGWITKHATQAEAEKEYNKLCRMKKTDASTFMLTQCRIKLGR